MTDKYTDDADWMPDDVVRNRLVTVMSVVASSP